MPAKTAGAGCDRFVISVRDLAVCIGKQQKGKSVELDNNKQRVYGVST